METNGKSIECVPLEVTECVPTEVTECVPLEVIELYTTGGQCNLSCNHVILSTNKGVK